MKKKTINKNLVKALLAVDDCLMEIIGEATAARRRLDGVVRTLELETKIKK